MRDRLSEQKVRVWKGDKKRLWAWFCPLHDCPAETLLGFGVTFEVTVYYADQHARRNHHHRHLAHDLER